MIHLPDHITYSYFRHNDVLEGRDAHMIEEILSDAEHTYLKSVSHEGRRREYTAGRLLARRLVADQLGITPGNVRLIVADDGSLQLPETSLSISLAHSKNGVCATIAHQTPIGIDLEGIKPRHPDLYRFILHPDEYSLLDNAPLSRDELLILCWALKEATLKGMKTGFRCSPKKIRLNIDFDNHKANMVVQGRNLWKGFFEQIDGNFLAIAIPDPEQIADAD